MTIEIFYDEDLEVAKQRFKNNIERNVRLGYYGVYQIRTYGKPTEQSVQEIKEALKLFLTY